MRAEHEIYTKTAAKALEINLNPQHYGVLAEIGAVRVLPALSCLRQLLSRVDCVGSHSRHTGGS